MRASIQPSKALCISEKRPTYLARSPLLVGPRRKKTDRGQRSAFLSETSWFAPLTLAQRGSALPWLVDDRAALRPRHSGAYSPGKTLPGFPRQCPLPIACHHLPKGNQIGARKRRAPGKHRPQPTIPPPRLNRPAESQRQPIGYISRG